LRKKRTSQGRWQGVKSEKMVLEAAKRGRTKRFNEEKRGKNCFHNASRSPGELGGLPATKERAAPVKKHMEAKMDPLSRNQGERKMTLFTYAKWGDKGGEKFRRFTYFNLVPGGV